MPGPLPFIPLPPAPAPAAANSSPRPRPEPPEQARPRSDDRPDSFSDTVDALDAKKDAPAPDRGDTRAQQPDGDAPAAPPEETVETPLIAAVEPVILPQTTPETETEIAPELLRRAVPTQVPEAKPVLAAQTATAAGATPNAVPVQPSTLPQEAEVTVPLDGELPAEDVLQTTRTASQPVAPAPQLLRSAQTPVETALVDEPVEAEGSDGPSELSVEPLEEAEVELPLPARRGPLETGPSTPQRSDQTTVTATMANTVQANTAQIGSDLPPPDEVLAALGQTASATPLGGLTAPGAAPAQIAQSAANQIVAALPRENGVVITNAGTEIALDPPELGRVRMIVTEVAGGLALTVTAERQETLDLFKRHAAMLAQEFAQEGFANTNFNFQGETDGGSEQNSDGTTTGAIDAPDVMAVVQPRAGQTGGLDLRL